MKEEDIKVGRKLKFISETRGLYTCGEIYEVLGISNDTFHLSDNSKTDHVWDFVPLSKNFRLVKEAKRKVGDVIIDKNGVEVLLVHSTTCRGCLYDDTQDCNPVRGDDDTVGCSDGNYMFVEAGKAEINRSEMLARMYYSAYGALCHSVFDNIPKEAAVELAEVRAFIQEKYRKYNPNNEYDMSKSHV